MCTDGTCKRTEQSKTNSIGLGRSNFLLSLITDKQFITDREAIVAERHSPNTESLENVPLADDSEPSRESSPEQSFPVVTDWQPQQLTSGPAADLLDGPFPTAMAQHESLIAPFKTTTNNTKMNITATTRSSVHRSATSCGDQFIARSQQQQQQPQYQQQRSNYPRDTGRRYYVRERKAGEDLLVNLLNLRDILLSQNVHV